MLLTIGSAVPEGKVAVSILLDLDYGLCKPQDVTLDSAQEWLESAHTEVENVFEASITQRSRELFGEVTG
jgi:uncharacterized protein (TIGR04255 family)